MPNYVHSMLFTQRTRSIQKRSAELRSYSGVLAKLCSTHAIIFLCGGGLSPTPCFKGPATELAPRGRGA